ncbi:DEAD/DEAH box helicase [Desulfovibrio ferrophilus]|uniref:DEAD/DEAH box helicase domain protein n=1 Tax=Desulfovibrio ferrophilus TaxID=241368 RepID=A0A2Z6B1T8_9BACT|nr:DEAD/DEAH box helicase [Desulfovibrio ferrophilus]BBD09462.1 DEAD/DEAH box helicase domain protein [Desulfovibrio ferrophilus]
MADIREYIEALKASERMGHLVAHHEIMPAREAEYGQCRRAWPVTVERVLHERGIEQLYSHQARSMDVLRSGRSVVAATPTASGKTLIYNLPVIEQVLANPDSRALYLFPLKALAQDQLKGFEELVAAWPKDTRPTAAIYDGDTTAWFRKKIRETPPNVLLTNPEMLHLALMPYHENWAAFFAGLTHIVVDEVHTYRGVLGSHMAQVFRRLKRVCRRYGADPAFAFLSATVGNPRELAAQLTGVEVEGVTESGAPQGARHFLFLNPAQTMADSPSQVAILMLKAALSRGMRTIVYTGSRKMTELIAMWASERAGKYKGKISAYRAGFLPEERRDIEERMASGDLLAVISTSALELGIDIGSLDLCILVGYPGTIMQTLQRGGRVGRAQQESAVALIAGEDQLDQYFMRNPQDFFARPPEQAVLNPYNPKIVEKHLVCAAAELAMRPDEPWLAEDGIVPIVRDLELRGKLLFSADGDTIHSHRKRPHYEVDLRGSGGQFQITTRIGQDNGGADPAKEVSVGQIDEQRAYKETHPGAVYLHRGKTYVVDDLDIGGRTVRVVPAKVDYYTRVRTEKTTEILSIDGVRSAWGMRVFKGRLKVTEHVTGYDKRRTRGGRLLTLVPLDLPPLTFETEGLWMEIPRGVQRRAEDEYMHFMGGIHALEHAAIGILPLLVMTDRNDLGGISTPFHPQVGAAAVFVYDGTPGGVGLSFQAFDQAEELLERTLGVIAGCPCEVGCPSCVHSPKCGSGNRPIDKAASRFLLEAIQSEAGPDIDAQALMEAFVPPEVVNAEPASAAKQGKNTVGEASEASRKAMSDKDLNQSNTKKHTIRIEVQEQTGRKSNPGTSHGQRAQSPSDVKQLDSEQEAVMNATENGRYGVFDLETQRSAAEVGGWHKAYKMGVSCACLFDSATGETRAYLEEEVPELIEDLQALPLVIGFNIKRFDYTVLKGYSRFDFKTLPTLDLLQRVHERLGYRLSLDHLAQTTLGAKKSADGLQALEWWKQGRIDDIVKYCKQDVAVTRDLYLYGRENGYLLFTNKAKNVVRLPVSW